MAAIGWTPMTTKYFQGFVSLGLLVLLSACGGGSGPDLSVAAEGVSYSQKASLTLAGNDLPRVGKVTVSKCSGLAVDATSTTTQKTLTCTVNGTGPLQVDLKDADGNVLFTKTFVVPEPRVSMTTSLGTLVVELNPTAAPVTVNNFLAYVSAGFYTNTLIHRVVPGFVAQGGLLTTAPAVQTGLRDPIALESQNGLSNTRGSIGMARTSVPNSATSQYYFNLVDNTGLNYVSATQPGYAVFGKVVQGLDVMDAIGSVATGSKYGLNDYPLTDVVVLSVRQVQ